VLCAARLHRRRDHGRWRGLSEALARWV